MYGPVELRIPSSFDRIDKRCPTCEAVWPEARPMAERTQPISRAQSVLVVKLFGRVLVLCWVVGARDTGYAFAFIDHLRQVTSVKLVEIRRRFEVAIVQAAWGGSWRCSAPAAGDVISTIASSCM